MSVSLVRNARSIFVSGNSVSPAECGYARNWFNANNDADLGRGRLAHSVIRDWISAGSPEVNPPAEIVATVFYRKIDKAGRPNGKTREAIVTRDAMPGGRGRPTTVSYVDASGLTREGALISRIVTDNGAVHSVSVDDETGEYVYRWESKADQKSVVLALLRALDSYRDAAIVAGVDVAGLDKAREASGV